MRRDFDMVLVGLKGAQLVDGDGAPLTTASVAVNALMGQYPDEQGISGEEKFKRYQLAARIAEGGVQDVSAEEVTLLKRLIGKAYTPMVVGPAYLALENDPEAAQSA